MTGRDGRVSYAVVLKSAAEQVDCSNQNCGYPCDCDGRTQADALRQLAAEMTEASNIAAQFPSGPQGPMEHDAVNQAARTLLYRLAAGFPNTRTEGAKDHG